MGMFDWFKVQSVQGPWQPPKNMMTGWQTKDLECGLHLVVLRTDGMLEMHEFADPEEESDEGLILDPSGSDRWIAEAKPIMFGKDFMIYVHHYNFDTKESHEYRMVFRDGRLYKARKIR